MPALTKSLAFPSASAPPSRLSIPPNMAASGRSPDPDDSNYGGGGNASSKNSLDSDGSEGESVATSLRRSCGSSNPTIGSDDEHDATVSAVSSSSPACHDDEDSVAKPFESLLRSQDRYEDDDSSAYSGFDFSDRTGGGASTSTSSPDACDYPIYRNAFYWQVLQETLTVS